MPIYWIGSVLLLFASSQLEYNNISPHIYLIVMVANFDPSSSGILYVSFCVQYAIITLKAARFIFACLWIVSTNLFLWIVQSRGKICGRRPKSSTKIKQTIKQFCQPAQKKINVESCLVDMIWVRFILYFRIIFYKSSFSCIL